MQGRKIPLQLLSLLIVMMQSVEMFVAVEKILLHRYGLADADDFRVAQRNLDGAHLLEINCLRDEYDGWRVEAQPSARQRR